jgi:hypothetical protein
MAGVFSVLGMPRRSVTDRADGSSFRCTLGGKGIVTRIVASLSMRVTPLPWPSSLPSWRKSGSCGSAAKRALASCGETVPVSRLWQVRQVRPLPPNVSRSNRRLPLRWRLTRLSASAPCAGPDRAPVTTTRKSSSTIMGHFTRLQQCIAKTFLGIWLVINLVMPW